MMDEQRVIDLSPEALWLQTLNYVRNTLDPDISEETIERVAREVYKAMEFLVKP